MALPSQRRFYESPMRIKGFSGPIGSGKTFALCYQALISSSENPGRYAMLCAPTYPMLRDATLATMLSILDEKRIPFTYLKSEGVLNLHRTGTNILFRSLDNYNSLRGPNLAWVGVDELTYAKEESWRVLEGRVRDPLAKHRRMFAAWTPKGYDWVYRLFINPRTRVEGYQATIAGAGENMAVLDADPDFYERLKLSYDERFYQQEVLGNYLNVFCGRVYYGFTEEKNCLVIPFNPYRGINWALDFNIDPLCSLITQEQTNEGLHILKELALGGGVATIYRMCERFCELSAEYLAEWGKVASGPLPVSIYGDRSGSDRSLAGKSHYELIKEYFRNRPEYELRWETNSSNPKVVDRVNSVNAMLCNARGEVRLTLDPSCVETISDFFEVSWKKENQTEIEKKANPKRSHLSDALGYEIWKDHRLSRFTQTMIQQG